MKPTIGRIVVFKGYISNGSDEHPAAVVNCNWSSNAEPALRAEKEIERCKAAGITTFICAFWPDRV